MFTKIIIVVFDGFGIGPLSKFLDNTGPNSLKSACKKGGVAQTPCLNSWGLEKITEVRGIKKTIPKANFGRSKQLSKFCESYSAHWEMAGCIQNLGQFYPQGFPLEIVAAVEKNLGVKLLGNLPLYPNIQDVPPEMITAHLETGYPILLHSSTEDPISTFALYGCETVLHRESLFAIAKQAREVLKHTSVQGRVSARIFLCHNGIVKKTKDRLDLPYFIPPSPNILDSILKSGRKTVATGKVGGLFNNYGFSTIFPDWETEKIWENTLLAMEQVESGLIWANLNDLNRPYGVERDCKGWVNCLNQYDNWLSILEKRLKRNEVLIFTGDHGRDPGLSGAQTREWTPLMVVGHNLKANYLGDRNHVDIAATIADWWNLDFAGVGTSFAKFIQFADHPV